MQRIVFKDALLSSDQNPADDLPLAKPAEEVLRHWMLIRMHRIRSPGPSGDLNRHDEKHVVGWRPVRHTARMNYLLAVAIGLVGGLTSGLFGVGGGIIMVPAMVLLMHTDMKVAVATSLAVIVPTTLASSILNQSFGRIDWRLVAALAVPAILGGLATTWFKEQIPSETLKRVFGGFVIVVGVRLLFFK